MRFVSALLLCSSLLALAPAAQAQTCFGNVAVARSSPLALVATASRSKHATTPAVTGYAGTDQLFGLLGASTTSVDDVDNRANSVRIGGGAQLAVGKASLCPYVQFSRAGGPNTPAFDVTAKTVTGGAALGIVAHDTGSMQVVPSVNLTFNRGSYEYDYGPDFELATAKNTYTALGVGVGFRFGAFSIQPSVGMLVGEDDADPSLQIEFAWSPWRK